MRWPRDAGIPKMKSNYRLLKCLVTIAILNLLGFQTIVDVKNYTALVTQYGKAVSKRPTPSSASFDIDKMEMSEIISMHSRSSYQHPAFDALRTNGALSMSVTANDQTNNIDHTMRILQDLGIGLSINSSEGMDEKIPPWSQVSANYGNKHVILGLERCQAYRETVPVEKRIMGLAGLFSSGTNVMHHLLLNNCEPPKGSQKPQRTFQWQVPW